MTHERACVHQVSRRGGQPSRLENEICRGLLSSEVQLRARNAPPAAGNLIWAGGEALDVKTAAQRCVEAAEVCVLVRVCVCVNMA